MAMSINELIDYLNKCKNKTQISLSNQYIDNEGLKVIAKFMKENSYVRKLVLELNQITDIAPLFKALKDNDTLEYLQLSYNEIADISEIKYLKNTKLKELELDYNNIKDVTPLLELLKVNIGIKKINYIKNNMNGISGLKEVLKINNTLEEFYYGVSRAKFLESMLEVFTPERIKDEMARAKKSSFHEMDEVLVAEIDNMLNENEIAPKKALARVVGNYLLSKLVKGEKFSYEVESRLLKCRKDVDKTLLDGYLKTHFSSLKAVNDLELLNNYNSKLCHFTDLVFNFDPEDKDTIDVMGDLGGSVHKIV